MTVISVLRYQRDVIKIEIKEERNKLTELLKNGELKKAEKALDAYFKLLAKAVNEERGMNE